MVPTRSVLYRRYFSMRRAIWGILVMALWILFPALSPAQHKEHGHPSEVSEDIGIDERLGEKVPLDLKFTDENGKAVPLGQLVDRPTIASLVYYTCPNMCPRILSSLAQVLAHIEMEPGKDFSVVTISFDERDTPDMAARKKKNYLKAIGKPFPEQDWRFLTGDAESIRRLTEAVGFHFQRRGEAFEHPAALLVLAPDGKITRYLYGLTYLPFDLKMALVEASEGRPGPTIRRVLLYCFSYDPHGRMYAFNFLKVTATIILFLAAVLFVYLPGQGRKRKRGET